MVANVRGYAVHTVPEHTFALILALRRSLIGYRQDVIAGEWQRAGQFCFFSHPIGDLHGATLGIIGEGTIGQSVARLGQAFGMRTLFAAHKGVSGLGPLYTPWDEVLETSDVITLHAPLMPATRDLIAMPEFRQMKRRPLADQRLARRPRQRGRPGQGARRGPDRGRGLRLPDRRAAGRGPSVLADPRAAERDRDAARRLGERGGDAGGLGPGDRQHRELRSAASPATSSDTTALSSDRCAQSRGTGSGCGRLRRAGVPGGAAASRMSSWVGQRRCEEALAQIQPDPLDGVQLGR